MRVKSRGSNSSSRTDTNKCTEIRRKCTRGVATFSLHYDEGCGISRGLTWHDICIGEDAAAPVLTHNSSSGREGAHGLTLHTHLSMLIAHRLRMLAVHIITSSVTKMLQ